MAGTKKIQNLRRAATAVLGVTTIVIIGVMAGPVRAGMAPAAAAKATAVAARPVDTAVGISRASADERGSSSSATSARVLGRDIATTRSDGDGTRSEAAARTRVPVTGGTVDVLPRRTTAATAEGRSASTASSDLVTARIPNLVSVDVLSSDADAVWTPRSSSARSSVDGARVDLFDGDLVIVLMHAEGSSDGRGRLYLVRINDATFFDSTDNGTMTLTVPELFSIELASSEARSGRFTGQVVRTAWLDSTSLDQFAAAVDAMGGSVGETHALHAAPHDTVELTATGSLPKAGAPILVLVLSALTLIEAGAAMTLVRTRARALA